MCDDLLLRISEEARVGRTLLSAAFEFGLILFLSKRAAEQRKTNYQIKSGGQECPPYSDYVEYYLPEIFALQQ